jgi:hypothetical protein
MTWRNGWDQWMMNEMNAYRYQLKAVDYIERATLQLVLNGTTVRLPLTYIIMITLA